MKVNEMIFYDSIYLKIKKNRKLSLLEVQYENTFAIRYS